MNGADRVRGIQDALQYQYHRLGKTGPASDGLCNEGRYVIDPIVLALVRERIWTDAPYRLPGSRAAISSILRCHITTKVGQLLFPTWVCVTYTDPPAEAILATTINVMRATDLSGIWDLLQWWGFGPRVVPEIQVRPARQKAWNVFLQAMKEE